MYDFKRYFYTEVMNKIEKFEVVFIFGPRKCGKTICMKQIAEEVSNSIYYDLKEMPNDERRKLREEVLSSIKYGEDVLLLLDEITYAIYPDLFIEEISNSFDDNPESRTKIVMSGSQSTALSYWASRSFASDAGRVYADFLEYDEYLEYVGKSDVTEETFKEYLLNMMPCFYNFDNIREYLLSCIDETIISNLNASSVIPTKNYSMTRDDIDILLPLCYAIFGNLHNAISNEMLMNSVGIKDKIEYYYKLDELDSNSLEVLRHYESKMKLVNRVDDSTLRKAIMFLKECGVISVTTIIEEFKYLRSQYSIIQTEGCTTSDIGKKFRICARYPIFYLMILKDIIPNLNDIPSTLLGSIVECHIRGLLHEGFEYHNADGVEIDYISYGPNIALEITISNKRMRKVHLDCVGEEFQKILLTKINTNKVGDIFRVPYYKFIYDLSKGLTVDEILNNLQSDEDITNLFD